MLRHGIARPSSVLDLSAPSALDEVVTSVTGTPPHWFAAVDGAVIDGLPELIRAHDLESAPLYLEAENQAAVRSGPYLVALPDQAAVATLLSITRQLPAMVFWSWPGDFAALRRHLRTLNLVRIPTEASTEAPLGDEPEASRPAHETVVFRHWDPNVLAILLSLLSREQISRFLGSANALIFDAVDVAAQLFVANRPADLPTPPAGMLQFTAEQIAALSDRRVEISRRRIAAYLRDVAPEYTSRIDDGALAASVLKSEAEAKQLGLASEADIGRWSYLQLIGGGQLMANASMVEAFTVPQYGATPTECLDRLYDEVEHRFRRSA